MNDETTWIVMRESQLPQFWLFDNREDARRFADDMQRRHTGVHYAIHRATWGERA